VTDDFDPSAAAARATGSLADGALDAAGDVDAGDVAEATEAASDAADAAEEVVEDAAEGSASTSSPTSVMDVLMHTEPDLSVDDVQDRLGLGPAASNALIGVRKVIHRLTGSGGGSGTPAIINFATAGYHAVGAVESDAGEDAGDENESTSSDDAPDLSGVPGA
jgi:hypothetical protein